MNKKIRCGLLIETECGLLEEIDTKHGGGTRSCLWDKKDLMFSKVHYRFRRIFEMGRHHRTSIYDFRCRPINFKQYTTFGHYIDKYGLSGRQTVIYLCLHDSNVDGNVGSRMTMMNKNKPLAIKTPTLATFKEKSSSSITSVQDFNHQQIPQSSSEYSFKIGIDELLKNARDLISQNTFDEIMIQLFENISIIKGYVCSTIDPLREKFQQSDDEYLEISKKDKIDLYLNSIMAVYDICQSTETLLGVKKNKANDVRLFGTFTNLFSQFYHHLKILRNQWLASVESNSNKVPTASSSTGSRVLSTPNPHIQSSSQDLAHQTVSSNIFKSLSSFQTSIKNETNEKFNLLTSLINYCNHLLNSEHLSSFHALIKSTIAELQVIQRNTHLFDKQSLHDAEKVVLSIKDQVKKNFYPQCFNQSKGELNRQLNESRKKILKGIQLLLRSLAHYRLQTDQNNQHEASNRSTPPPLFINQQQSNKRKSQNLHNDDDDDQSSVTISSSVDDEILFISARNTFGYKSRRFH